MNWILQKHSGRVWALLLLLMLSLPRHAAAQQPIEEFSSFSELKTKAEEGDAKAQYLLGRCYKYGQLVKEDKDEAVRWIRKSAEQGYAKAQLVLGLIYEGGHGVAKDGVEAAKWFRKAAEQGDASALGSIGRLYQFGDGVARDMEEAARWYRKAAEKGDVIAQYSLGRCYSKGNGVAKSGEEAAKWFRKSAEQGYADAQCDLGYCYGTGDGVIKDIAEALKWMRKAAEQGRPVAQYNLGAFFAKGEGVPRDYVEAHRWLNLAAAGGDEDAKRSLLLLERTMTMEQIAEAQRLAREFKPRKPAEGNAPTSREDGADSGPKGSGTGFFITEDGFLVTNEHVVKGADQVRLGTSAGLVAAKVVKVDEANDVALLKAEGKFTALPVVSSRTVTLGKTVATVGFPNVGLQGFAPKLAKGEIAALTGIQDDPKYFQISVPVQPGNSGGALVDERGNVVGVVSAKLSARVTLATTGTLPENVNYAIKSSFLLGFLEAVPTVAAKLKEPAGRECKFEDVVKTAEKAAVLVLVY